MQKISKERISYGENSFEFFAFNTKFLKMAMLESKDFTAAKKVTSSGLDLMLTNGHWIKDLMLIQLS